MSKRQKGLRVLLLSPPYQHLGGEELFGFSGREEWFPLGVFTLANAIRSERIAAVHIYYHPDYTPATLEAVIREHAPDIIGITCSTITRFACFELAEIVKGINRDIKVVVGGVHAAFLDKQIMENYPCVDMIIRGYAEGAFRDVIKAILNQRDFTDIAGLTWRDKNNQIHRNVNRSLENDLNQEITPDIRDLFIGGLPTWKSKDMIFLSVPVETGRGCVYACSFCSRIGPENRTMVMREPVQALRYVHELLKIFGCRGVYFCDNVFTINRKRVFEFCDLLQSQPFKLEWTCSTRVDLVDKEILDAMKQAGCHKIYYGVDSLCREILPAIGRNYRPETAVENLNLSVACGLEVEANLIIGFPMETIESVMEAYSYRKQLHPSVLLNAFPLLIMPGAPLYYQALKEGFQEDYWLEDHGPRFPIYTGAMSEKRILEYCRMLKNPQEYIRASKKGYQKYDPG